MEIENDCHDEIISNLKSIQSFEEELYEIEENGWSIDYKKRDMKTKNIEVCDAIFIDISCQSNDPVDIRAGGPEILGYEFYVSPDEDIKEIEDFLKKCIKKYNQPYMGMTNKKREDFPVKHLWTKEKMEECIKNNEF